MTLFTKKKNYHLKCAALRESGGNVPGPGRGWYRIYSYTLGKEISQLLPPVRYEGETLALVMIDIGAGRDDDISETHLEEIRKILAAFVDAGMDMLLRVVYDTEGKGMEKEPSLFAQVLRHIRQIGGLLPEYADHILLFQGLFVGSWGEMHTSKFLTEKQIRQMMESFLEATKGKIRLAFRTPRLLRKIVKEEEKLPEMVGFFDDALLADETHMGTFGTLSRADAGWTQAWRAEDEIAFLEKAAERVPFGGELVNGMEELSAKELVEQLEKLRVSYLNCVHDANCLARWRGMSVAPGVSLFDYVGAHLGYRFVVEAVELVRKGKTYFVQAELANKGFASYPADVRLSLCRDAEETGFADLCPRDLPGGGHRSVSFALPEDALLTGSRFFLRLVQKDNKRALPFANEGAEELLFVGALEGQ